MENYEAIPSQSLSYKAFLQEARAWELEAQRTEEEVPEIAAGEKDTFNPELDKQLAKELKEITKGKISTYKFHQVENEEEEKSKFFEALSKGQKYEPVFSYSDTETLPLEDAYKTLNQLKSFRERIGRKTPLARLYTRMSIENSRMVIVAALSQTPGFAEASRKLYKTISNQEKDSLGKEISAFINTAQNVEQVRVNVDDAVTVLKEVVEKLGLDTEVRVKPVDEMTSATSASSKTISVREDYDKPLSEAVKVWAHEPGHTIIQTRGKKHPCSAGSRKTPQGLQIEEALNITTEQMIFSQLKDSMELPEDFREERDVLDKIRAYAIKIAETHSFYQTYESLIDLGVNQKWAWDTSLRTKRGLPDVSKPGANHKDISYYLGLKKLQKELSGAEDENAKFAILDRLSQGRFSIEESRYLQQMGLENNFLPYKKTYPVLLEVLQKFVESKVQA
jgi:hypothetical protein